MLDFFRQLFDTDGFPARWNCGVGWTPLLGWTHIVSDLLTWGAYMAIPFVLAYFVLKRGDLPFPKLFWFFVAFIFACGTVHLIEATIFWYPWYRLSAVFKVGMAGVSWATVIAMVPVMPQALRLRTPAQLEEEVQDRTKSLLKSERRRRILMSELDHRVKNNITAIMSLADQSMRASSDFEHFRASFLGRLHAMARTHESLSATKWQGASLHGLIGQTLAPYEGAGVNRVSVQGESITLPARATGSMSMCLHELATNSVKYGALSVPEGDISLSWSRADDDLTLRWEESGGPDVMPPAGEGFGTLLLRGVIEHDLHGEVTLDYAKSGLICTIQIPNTALDEGYGLADMYAQYQEGVEHDDDVLR